jgi:RNA polymerase sigma factor for flagellar operon FliA
MYNAKGRTSTDKLLHDHMPMVKKLAFQLKAKLPANVEVDDLIQAGMIGLLDAINKYEVVETAQFETYAVQRIRGSMLDELRSNDWLPRTIRQNMRKVESAMTELRQQLQRPPTETEIAQKLDVSLAVYQKMLADNAGHQLIYFEDFQTEGEDGDHFLDRFQSDDLSDPLAGLMDHGFKAAVISAIDALPERDKLIMSLYYEQELNLKEIGAVLEITESRVSQLHSQAIGRIRGILKAQKWTEAA